MVASHIWRIENQFKGLGAYAARSILIQHPRCSAGWPNKRGYYPPVSDSLGPGLCRILDMDFREHLF